MAVHLIDSKEAMSRLRLARTAFDRLSTTDARFPQPIRLSGRRRWVESEFDQYLTDIIAAERGTTQEN